MAAAASELAARFCRGFASEPPRRALAGCDCPRQVIITRLKWVASTGVVPALDGSPLGASPQRVVSKCLAGTMPIHRACRQTTRGDQETIRFHIRFVLLIRAQPAHRTFRSPTIFVRPPSRSCLSSSEGRSGQAHNSSPAEVPDQGRSRSLFSDRDRRAHFSLESFLQL